jgi:hypothetical protein
MRWMRRQLVSRWEKTLFGFRQHIWVVILELLLVCWVQRPASTRTLALVSWTSGGSSVEAALHASKWTESPSRSNLYLHNAISSPVHGLLQPWKPLLHCLPTHVPSWSIDRYKWAVLRATHRLIRGQGAVTFESIDASCVVTEFYQIFLERPEAFSLCIERKGARKMCFPSEHETNYTFRTAK